MQIKQGATMEGSLKANNKNNGALTTYLCKNKEGSYPNIKKWKW